MDDIQQYIESYVRTSTRIARVDGFAVATTAEFKFKPAFDANGFDAEEITNELIREFSLSKPDGVVREKFQCEIKSDGSAITWRTLDDYSRYTGPNKAN